MTSIFSKVIERVVLKCLLLFLLNNNLITRHQSGFLPEHSTSQQLIEICKDIAVNLTNNLATTIVFADISRAFDKLSPKGLYTKLNQYGIPDKLRKWIYSFLTNRYQRTCVGGTHSEWGELMGAWPKARYLDPSLFYL